MSIVLTWPQPSKITDTRPHCPSSTNPAQILDRCPSMAPVSPMEWVAAMLEQEGAGPEYNEQRLRHMEQESETRILNPSLNLNRGPAQTQTQMQIQRQRYDQAQNDYQDMEIRSETQQVRYKGKSCPVVCRINSNMRET